MIRVFAVNAFLLDEVSELSLLRHCKEHEKSNVAMTSPSGADVSPSSVLKCGSLYNLR